MRQTKDFLADDAFIIAVFEGIDVYELKSVFQVDDCELNHLREAVEILLVPFDISCGLSELEKNRIKNNCLLLIEE